MLTKFFADVQNHSRKLRVWEIQPEKVKLYRVVYINNFFFLFMGGPKQNKRSRVHGVCEFIKALLCRKSSVHIKRQFETLLST